MAPSNAEKQKKLLIAENGAKRSFQSCKTTYAAANCGPSSSSILPNLMWLGIGFGIYFAVGSSCFYALRDHIRGKKTEDFIDSIYMCVVTMTTVGYGDLFPHSTLSRLVCTVFITVGMCLFGIVVKIAAKYLVVKQQMVMINALHTARKVGPMEAIDEIEGLEIDYTKCLISLAVMGVHFVLGVFVMVNVEGMDFSDAVYCASTTMTTVGFGDESFSTEIGRMFGILWITTGTSCLGQLFLYIAEVYTDIETKKLVKWVISSNVIDKDDPEAAEIVEHDKVYGAADFILHKLKEMGKIKQEDISVAMKDIDDVINDLDVADHQIAVVSDMILAAKLSKEK